MAETHDLGPLFVQGIWLKLGSPLFHVGATYELEEPYRESRKTLIVRIPFSCRAIAIGFWRKTGRTEDDALIYAVRADMDEELTQDYLDNLQSLPEVEETRRTNDSLYEPVA